MNEYNMDRTSNIARSLCRYYLQKGCQNFTISFRLLGTDCFIEVAGNVALETSEYETIYANLSKPVAPELAHYYDELLASGGDDEDFSLMGYLVDVCNIEYKEGKLSLGIRHSYQSKIK